MGSLCFPSPLGSSVSTWPCSSCMLPCCSIKAKSLNLSKKKSWSCCGSKRFLQTVNLKKRSRECAFVEYSRSPRPNLKYQALDAVPRAILYLAKTTISPNPRPFLLGNLPRWGSFLTNFYPRLQAQASEPQAAKS